MPSLTDSQPPKQASLGTQLQLVQPFAQRWPATVQVPIQPFPPSPGQMSGWKFTGQTPLSGSSSHGGAAPPQNPTNTS